MKKLVEITNLKKYFQAGKGHTVKAVDGVSIHVGRGETLALVGESGCGKTTLGRTVVGLYRPTAGLVTYEGKDVHRVSGREKKSLCRRMQMIFQDPYSSLNPRMTAGEIIGEGLDIHFPGGKERRRQRVHELMQLVGLRPGHSGRYPHEFSGGQRQRIAIARALAVEPEFIVCDEAVSALDVSVQAQVINLLKDLQISLGLTYLFITHDLSLVRYISSRVAVMCLGRIVELADCEALFENPLHPYTQALLTAIPLADPDAEAARHRFIPAAAVPEPAGSPAGCSFSGRCPQARPECKRAAPVLWDAGDGHFVACHLA
ncbi:MAG: ABC transporter ATP-binding protein [Peptococcaceae bacterium]|nr:ABC transporter ATP-binding protein [Peptococcaceae bacterium]